MTEHAELPAAVEQLMHDADRVLSGAEATVGWSRKAWSRLEDHQHVIDRLSSRITESEVLGYARAITDPQSALAAFIATMVWGHGRSGYGPFRTGRVIDENGGPRQFGEELLRIAQTCFQDGGVTAFGHIAARRRVDRGYLKHLGPAFGTKYLYFCTRASTNAAVPPAPILDAVSARWFADHVLGDNPGEGQLKVWWWDEESYLRYVTTLTRWSGLLGVEVVAIARLILATSDPDERSGASSGRASRVIPPAPDVHQALAHLVRAIADSGDRGLIASTADSLAGLESILNRVKSSAKVG